MTIYWIIFFVSVCITALILGLGSYLIQINNSSDPDKDKLDKIKTVSIWMTVAGSISTFILFLFLVYKIKGN
jgi:hypothetical protein